MVDTGWIGVIVTVIVIGRSYSSSVLDEVSSDTFWSIFLAIFEVVLDMQKEIIKVFLRHLLVSNRSNFLAVIAKGLLLAFESIVLA